MKYQQVSMIDDLPELEQVESRYTTQEQYTALPDKVVSLGIGDMEQPKVRGIREKMVLHEGSGMRPNYSPPTFGPEGAPVHYSITPSPQFENTNYMHQPYYSDAPQNINYAGHPQPQIKGEVIENLEMPSHHHIDCRNIYEHIAQCPICAKFYKHDTTLYLILIAILIIACALLLKRVLRV